MTRNKLQQMLSTVHFYTIEELLGAFCRLLHSTVFSHSHKKSGLPVYHVVKAHYSTSHHRVESACST